MQICTQRHMLTPTCTYVLNVIRNGHGDQSSNPQ